MEQFVTLLLENPLFLVIAVIVSVVVLLTFLRKMFKFLVIVVAAGILYVAYLYWSGENVMGMVNRIEQALNSMFARWIEFLWGIIAPE